MTAETVPYSGVLERPYAHSSATLCPSRVWHGVPIVPVITQTREGRLSPLSVSCSNSVLKKTHQPGKSKISVAGKLLVGGVASLKIHLDGGKRHSMTV